MMGLKAVYGKLAPLILRKGIHLSTRIIRSSVSMEIYPSKRKWTTKAEDHCVRTWIDEGELVWAVGHDQSEWWGEVILVVVICSEVGTLLTEKSWKVQGIIPHLSSSILFVNRVPGWTSSIPRNF